MKTTTLLSLVKLTDDQLAKLRAVDKSLEIHVVADARHDDVPQDVRQEVEIILGTSSIIHDPAALPNLKWVQAQSAGVNYLADKPVWRSEVILTKASGIHAAPLSERIMAMMLAFRANLPLMWQKRKWLDDKQQYFNQPTLRGSTVGIVGYGAIGAELGRQAQALGMRVLAMNRSGERNPITTYTEPGCGDPEMRVPGKVFAQSQLMAMLPECDHVVVLAPLTDETRHMFNEAAFERMKDSGYFYNFARGSLADEAALIAALQNGTIAGAGLDVFEKEPLPDDSPLWEMSNVIITPHVGGHSIDYNDRLIELFIVNLKRYFAGEPLLNVVDPDAGY